MDEFVKFSDISEKNANRRTTENAAFFKAGQSMLNERTLPPPQYGLISTLIVVFSLSLLKRNLELFIGLQLIFFDPHLAIFPYEWTEYCEAVMYSVEWIFVMTWAFLYALPWQKEGIHLLMLCFNILALIMFVLLFGIISTVTATAAKFNMFLWPDWPHILAKQLIVVFLFMILKTELQREYQKARNL